MVPSPAETVPAQQRQTSTAWHTGGENRCSSSPSGGWEKIRGRQNLFVEERGKGHGQFGCLRDKNKAEIILLSTSMLLRRLEKISAR